MTTFLQSAKHCINLFPSNIMEDTKVGPGDITPELNVRLRQHKRALTEHIEGQNFVFEPDALAFLSGLGAEYLANRTAGTDHDFVLPFPEMILDCPSPDGEQSHLAFVRQQGPGLKFEPFTVAERGCVIACSVRFWDLETDHEETYFTATHDLLRISQPKHVLDAQEAEDDVNTAFAKLVTIGLCLLLDDPRYLRAERDYGNYTRQQLRQAERQGRKVTAFSTIRIKLTEEGVRKHHEMLERKESDGVVRKLTCRHHVRAHTVRRRNGTTYQRRAHVRGQGEMIEQTRSVSL